MLQAETTAEFVPVVAVAETGAAGAMPTVPADAEAAGAGGGRNVMPSNVWSTNTERNSCSFNGETCFALEA